MEIGADLVALALLQGVALRAAGLEEVGTLLSIACDDLLATIYTDEAIAVATKKTRRSSCLDRKADTSRITPNEMREARLSSFQYHLATCL